MTIKTATKLAATAVAIGLVVGLSYPTAIRILGYELNWTNEQRAAAYSWFNALRLILTDGALLFFLAVLASKQKEQA